MRCRPFGVRGTGLTFFFFPVPIRDRLDHLANLRKKSAANQTHGRKPVTLGEAELHPSITKQEKYAR